jgi:hypothetical protein
VLTPEIAERIATIESHDALAALVLALGQARDANDARAILERL